MNPIIKNKEKLAHDKCSICGRRVCDFIEPRGSFLNQVVAEVFPWVLAVHLKHSDVLDQGGNIDVGHGTHLLFLVRPKSKIKCKD